MVIKSPTALLIVLCLALAGCGQQSAEKNWDYRSFEFSAHDTMFWSGDASGPESKADPAPFFDSGSLLTRLNSRGWELVWTDGRQFIVRADAGKRQNNAFVIQKTR